MKQSLIPLLEKHFSWSQAFCANVYLSPAMQCQLEGLLPRLENLMRLQANQLANLIQQEKTGSLIFYLIACFKIGRSIDINEENFYFQQLNSHLQVLLSCQFTHQQIESFDPRLYLSFKRIDQLFEEIQLCTLAYQSGFFQSHQVVIASMFESHQPPNTDEIDEDMINSLLQPPSIP
jgi:hypothetical protein